MQPAAMHGPLLVCALLLAGCRSEPSTQELIELSLRAEAAPKIQPTTHQGPAVAPGETGTARFAAALWESYSADAALAVTAFADRWYRAPGNEGFDATIDEVRRRLAEAGFGARAHLELQVIETPLRSPAWTPRRARLALVRGGEERVLHAFDSSEGRDRTMLPVGAPSAKLEARPVTRAEDAGPGTALILEGGLRGAALRKAAEKGATLAIASDLAEYNVDPTGRERHLDAIGFRSVGKPPLAVVQVSPRVAAELRAAAQDPAARVRFEAVVETAERPLRTLVATVVGAREPSVAVPIVAHVQEPGACDNASGVGTVTECAVLLARLIEDGKLGRPARSIAFVFGDEMEQSRVWLERSGRTAYAALAADMTGESAAETGARALLERAADPGALKPLLPDEHTAWGAARVGPEDLRPDGLAVVLRCALADVAAASGGWRTAEHPFEGGSDHVVFLGRGVPSALLWHFPDWAYHTSADRMEHVDPAEMKRTGCALLSAALALADPRPADLERYLRSLKLEIDLRAGRALEENDDELAARWTEWGAGARQWIRELCLGRAAALPAGTQRPTGDQR